MDAFVLAAIIGVPLAIALYVIDAVAVREPTWRTEAQLQAATGAFWDRPERAGRRATRHAAETDVEARPEVAGAEERREPSSILPTPAPLGVEQPAGRQAV